MTDKQHGGKRQGAGRKPLPASERLQPTTVYLTQAQIEWIRERGEVSEFLRQCVEERMSLRKPSEE